MSPSQKRVSKIEAATNNMACLIDSIVKDALKNYRKAGEIGLDAKFLKESVTILREMWNLLDSAEEPISVDEGIVIKLEGQVEKWCK